ncbi:MAG: hypothetical protein ACOX4F_09070 [Atopobiaceae bacterium]|jgi:hypothetical protein
MAHAQKRWTDAIIRPVKKTLFGDPDYDGGRSQAQESDVAELGQILADVCALGWADWRSYAFAREPLVGRISSEQQKELMEQARICGELWAARLTEKFGTADPQELARALGATVSFAEKPHSQDRVLFAEFTEPNEIYVYTDALDKAKALLQDASVRAELGENFSPEQVLIAHEVYHLVELSFPDEVWTHTYRFDLRIGPIKNPSKLAVLEEIAAMSFARALTHIRFSPYVLDIFLTYAYSPEAGTMLYREVMGYQNKSAADVAAKDTKDEE